MLTPIVPIYGNPNGGIGTPYLHQITNSKKSTILSHTGLHSIAKMK